MIQEKNLLKIGKILKPHGVKGDMTFLFDQQEFAEADNNYYFFLLDGLFVPFFVEDFRFTSDKNANIKIEGIDAIEEAVNYNDTFIYLPKELIGEIKKDEYLKSEWEQFIGYTILDESKTVIGVIKEVDSSTMNVLFVVENKDEDVLIPATIDFIIEVNQTEQQIFLKLPEGLIENID